MSQAAVEQVVGRLLLDRKFRQQMTNEMQTALAGFELTEGERKGFKGIDLDDFHESVTGLDQRVSKGILQN